MTDPQYNEPPRYNKLYLDKKHGKICGVCAGIADYTGVDPTIIRVVAIIGLLSPASGIICIAYFLLCWLLDRKPDDLFETKEQDAFWKGVRTQPKNTIRDVRHKFRHKPLNIMNRPDTTSCIWTRNTVKFVGFVPELPIIPVSIRPLSGSWPLLACCLRPVASFVSLISCYAGCWTGNPMIFLKPRNRTPSGRGFGPNRKIPFGTCVINSGKLNVACGLQRPM